MKYRRFGRTQLQMPVFSCGGMRYQHKWQDVEWSEVPAENQANLEATVHRAVDVGINHIETARGYGSSEMQLGPVLRQFSREKLIVQTKVMPQPEAKEFRAIFEKSMSYLQLDHVELLSMHGINNRQHLHDTLKKGGCLDEARKIQREGRARFIGFSTHATTDIILEAVESGEFDYINIHWYFVNDLNWHAIEAAHQRDMGVFIISPNDKGGKLYSPPQKLVDLCQPLTPMAFNNLYCLARPEIHTLSVGAAQPSDFDAHLASLAHYDHAGEMIQSIEQRLRAEMNATLGADWCAHWFEGLPHYVEVPGEINLMEILRLWTFAKSLDLVEWGKMRYNLLGQGEHWFPGEHMGQADLGGLKEVIAKSQFAARIPSILQEAHEMLFDAPKKRLSQT